MAHPRELITQAVVELLKTAGTLAGDRVDSMRVDRHKKSALPAVSVYGLSDPTNEDASSEMEEAHDLELQVELIALSGVVNTLAAEVEAAMRGDVYLGGLASNTVHKGTVVGALQGADGHADPNLSIAVITYSVSYHIALAGT